MYKGQDLDLDTLQGFAGQVVLADTSLVLAVGNKLEAVPGSEVFDWREVKSLTGKKLVCNLKQKYIFTIFVFSAITILDLSIVNN